MKINASFVRSERAKRAWSQEHLAAVSGLGVRTIHRIETDGLASPESVKALAAVFDLETSNLTDFDHSIIVPRRLSGILPLLEALVSLVSVVNEAIVTMKTHKRLTITFSSLIAALACAWISFLPASNLLSNLFIFFAVSFETVFWANQFLDLMDSNRSEADIHS